MSEFLWVLASIFGEAGEVTQWLEALFAHPEDLSWVPGLTSGSSQPPIT